MIHEAKLLEPMSPKLSEKSNVETSPTHTGSETSRSYQPEGKKIYEYFLKFFLNFLDFSKFFFIFILGSIDLSPSCSESQPTTPSYLKWAENMQYLLDDGDGCTLFKNYLDQQSLGHLIEFV